MDRAVIIKWLEEKRTEFNVETHLLFVDYEKAFELVLRSKLWGIKYT
jgi:hypothetical protein